MICIDIDVSCQNYYTASYLRYLFYDILYFNAFSFHSKNCVVT